MPLNRSPVRVGFSVDQEVTEKENASVEVVEKNPGAVKSSVMTGEVYAAEFRNVRIATFWRNRPKLWFAHLESEFTAYRVRSNDVRYSAIIRHLDEQMMIAVLNVFEQPPSQGKFETLKEVFIQRFSVSQEKKLRTLLGLMELRGKTPSKLLGELRTLAGKDVIHSLLQTLWTQRLPQHIQELLAVLEDVNLDKLAAYADKALERYAEPEVASVYEDFSVNSVAVLEGRLKKMELEIAALRVKSSRFHSRRRRCRSSSQQSEREKLK